MASALLAGIPAKAALADDFSLAPTLRIAEEYSDNILFSATNPKGSFTSTLAPHLKLNERTERLSLLLDAGCSYLVYSAHSDLNSLDQVYQGQLGYRLTPRLNLQSTASFARESRPDRFVETTGLVTTLESTSQSYGASADMALTEKLAGQLGYSYQQVDYSGSSTSGVQVHSITGGMNYDLAELVPLLKLRTNLGYSSTNYTQATVEGYSATIGLSYPLHELWGFQADFGGRFTRSTFDSLAFVPPYNTVTVKKTNDDIGWVASLSLNYQGELDSAKLSVTRNVQNAAGRSGSTELTAVTVEFGHKFSYELSGSLSAGYYQNSSTAEQFSTQAIDTTSYRIRPAMRYEFSRDVSLDLAYEYGTVQDHQAGSNAGRNKVSLQLSMKHTLFE